MEPKARASQANKAFGSAGSQELMIKKSWKDINHRTLGDEIDNYQ